MCLFDIDNFKVYNDEYGHLCGDECLRAIAHTLQKTAGRDYFVSRYGGDEFVVLGINKSDREVEQFAKKLFLNVGNTRISLEDKECPSHVTISMGIVNEPVERGTELAGFIHRSDDKLYQAKKMGKNCYWFDRQKEQEAGKEPENP